MVETPGLATIEATKKLKLPVQPCHLLEVTVIEIHPYHGASAV